MTVKPTLPGKVWRLWTEFPDESCARVADKFLTDKVPFGAVHNGWHIDIIPAPETCTWTEDEDGTWTSGCGKQFDVEPPITPTEIGPFAPCCGKRIIEHRYEEQGDDDASEA